MTYSACPKCQMMIAEVAAEIHQTLNHPKRHAGNLVGLEKARAVRAQQRAEINARAVQLTATWEGRIV